MSIIPLKELKALLPPGKRVMGIDHSKNMLGLALANPELTLATPLKTLKRTKFNKDIKELAKICGEYNVGGFVIGLPLNMDGSEGPRCESVRHFAENILQAADILGFMPLIVLQDERLSTYTAEESLINDLDISRAKRQNVIDAAAAAHILQSTLDAINA